MTAFLSKEFWIDMINVNSASRVVALALFGAAGMLAAMALFGRL